MTLSIIITGFTGTWFLIQALPADDQPMTRTHRKNLAIGILLLVACFAAPIPI